MNVVDRHTLLGSLPAYNDQWVMVNPNQNVRDIIREVLKAHREFAPYYDKIALYFSNGNLENVCDALYSFCKDNIRYKEETEEDQTSALPTGVLTRGQGDCKHYSGFIGGVLDALTRQGTAIDWNYRFASYSPIDSEPHHVFIVVNYPDGSERWLDPTPGSDTKIPFWYMDKKISTMALRRNISGMGDMLIPQTNQALIRPEMGDNAKVVWYNGSWKIIPGTGGTMSGEKVGDIVESAITVVSALSDLIGGGKTGKRAAQKMFDMFPLLPGASASTIQQTIAAIQAHYAADPGGQKDPEWSAAYADILRQYGNALALVRKGYPMPTIVVPPIGQGSFTSLPPGVPSANLSSPGTLPSSPLPNYASLPASGSFSNINWPVYLALGLGAYLLLKPKRRK